MTGVEMPKVQYSLGPLGVVLIFKTSWFSLGAVVFPLKMQFLFPRCRAYFVHSRVFSLGTVHLSHRICIFIRSAATCLENSCFSLSVVSFSRVTQPVRDPSDSAKV